MENIKKGKATGKPTEKPKYSTVRCMVFTCKSKGNMSGVEYFWLNKSRRISWLNALRRNLNEPLSDANAVCSQHFSNEDKIFVHGKLKLKPEAVPKLELGFNPQYQTVHNKHAVIASEEEQNVSSVVHNEGSNENYNEFVLENFDVDHEEVVGDVQEPRSTTSNSPRNSLPANDYTFFMMNILLFVWCLILWIVPASISFACGTKRNLSSSSDSTGLRGETKRDKKELEATHNYAISSRKFGQELQNKENENKGLKENLKKANKKISRLSKKVSTLKDIILDLRAETVISEHAAVNLEKTFSGIPLALLKRLLNNIKNFQKGKKQTTKRFPEELRSFAMTLQFYSSKAYDYVRTTFHLSLPSPSTIRSWLSNVKCEPGFTENSFAIIKELAEENNEKKISTICSLMLDEIAIRKQVEYIGTKTWGYTDFGTGLEDDNLECATEALVLMVVAVNSNWKLPIGYFFIKSLTGAEKANIVREALIKLHYTGVKITSVTFDGPNANFTMASELGAQINDVRNIVPWFHHPVGMYKVYIFFDPCHMIKLLRNNWATLQVFIDENGERVDFSFIKQLHNVQEQEMLRFGTKLGKQHIEWQKQKMKVNLAAQTISGSVADAIDMLRDVFKLPQFKNSQATTRFIRLFNKVFDALNGRNPYAVGTKAPLKKINETRWKPLFEEAIDYLMNLKNLENSFLFETRNKTPVRGFIIDMIALIGIFHDYVKSNGPLQYILPYKLSQDHIELFFLCIRSRNGWNNNPTCHQFFCNYRRLALNLDIKGVTGNCAFRDDTYILRVTGSKNIVPVKSVSDINIIKKYQLDVPNEIEFDDIKIIFINDLTMLSKNVVVYIAGFVVKKLKIVLKCPQCLDACESDYLTSDDTFALLDTKNRGGLTRPSEDINCICYLVERRLRNILNLTNNKVPNESNFSITFIQKIAIDIFEENKMLKKLNDHICDHPYLDVHPKMSVIRETVKFYLKIRLYSVAKKQTEVIKGELVRKKLSKLILFHNQ